MRHAHSQPIRVGTAFPSGGRWHALALIFLMALAASAAPVADPAPSDSGTTLKVIRAATEQLGSWIWAERTYDKQTCRLWQSFEIPANREVSAARLLITADNTFRLFLDGREIGQGSEWRRMTEYDLSRVLKPGLHVLAVECFNDWSAAGMILGLEVSFKQGEALRVLSDDTWRIVPNDLARWESRTTPQPNWGRAIVLGKFNARPWEQLQPYAALAPAVTPLELRFWQQGWFQVTLLSVCVSAILVSLRLMTQLAAQRRGQALLHQERARIARDFHDDLGARITQLVLLGEVARRELPAGADTRGKLDQMCNRMRELSAAMKEVVWVVNSQRDTLHDFANHLTGYAETFLQGAAIRCRFDVGLELPDAAFDLPIRRNLFLAVKEALNNAAKHSQATELFLRVHWDGTMVEVLVENNGRGFAPAQVGAGGNGIANMTQRMAEFAGECRIESTPGKGSRITFKMPLSDAPRRARWRDRWTRKAPAAQATVEPDKTAPANGARTVDASASIAKPVRT